MKKVMLALLAAGLLSSPCRAAVSEDMSVYVRQDVFDAKMEALFSRLDGRIEAFRSEIKSEISNLRGEISDVRGDIKALSAEMNGNMRELSARIDGVEKRMDTMNTFLYYLLVLLGAILILPFVNKLWDTVKETKAPTITLEDVRRLIEENNARMSVRPQATA